MHKENSWFRMASYWDELETCRRVQVWFGAEPDRLQPVDIYNKLKGDTNKKMWN